MCFGGPHGAETSQKIWCRHCPGRRRCIRCRFPLARRGCNVSCDCTTRELRPHPVQASDGPHGGRGARRARGDVGRPERIRTSRAIRDRFRPACDSRAGGPQSGGAWATLGQNLMPEYYVVSGVRRMTTQQGQPLEDLGVNITPEVIEKNKWYAFWDAPLVMPAPPPAAGVEGRGRAAGPSGGVGRVYGAPRDPKEIRRTSATFSAGSCAVKTDGARLEVNFPGLSMGIFTGSLRFTSYRGTNLFRMEAIAKTDEPSVAYKYEAGLKGLSTSLLPRVTLARHRGQSAAVRVRRPGQRTSRHRSREESRARRGRQSRVDGHLHSAPRVFLHARSRHEPRVRLVSQGRRDAVRPGRSSGRWRRRRGVRRELRAATTRLLERCSGWRSISTPVRTPPIRRARR